MKLEEIKNIETAIKYLESRKINNHDTHGEDAVSVSVINNTLLQLRDLGFSFKQHYRSTGGNVIKTGNSVYYKLKGAISIVKSAYKD